jgi:hypothetical protein
MKLQRAGAVTSLCCPVVGGYTCYCYCKTVRKVPAPLDLSFGLLPLTEKWSCNFQDFCCECDKSHDLMHDKKSVFRQRDEMEAPSRREEEEEEEEEEAAAAAGEGGGGGAHGPLLATNFPCCAFLKKKLSPKTLFDCLSESKRPFDAARHVFLQLGPPAACP